MGCCGGEREKFGDLNAEQKWDYINLDDFKSSSCWTPFAYGYLLVMLVVSLSVYAVDTFTAIQLLAFDRWAGQIKPEIPLNISRWIFAGCIILSFVLLAYRWLRAIRVMRQGGVARNYLDPLAVRAQSIRWGRARGWKRFLVFAELTKSRKGADYVALFTYFSFEAWLRIVFAEGPRQAVNAITLYSVLKLKLIPVGEHAPDDGHSPVVQFFVNIGILADSNHLQAVVLFGMLWTLVIWVISMISFIVSVILYLLFLWHHIPSGDGGLTGYCRKKINRRMERVVRAKVDKALKKENQRRARQEAIAAREGLDIKKQPTLPNLSTDTVDAFPGLSRQTTMTTLPEYSSRPGTGTSSNESLPTLPNISTRPPMPKRTVTHGSEASWDSYTSSAPLIGSAGEMGMTPDRAQDPNGPWYGKPLPNRSFTGLSQFSQRSFSPALPRPGTAQGDRSLPGSYQMDPLPRSGSSMSNNSRPGYSSSNSGALPYPDDRSSTSSKPPSWSGPNADSPMDSMGRRTPAAVGPSFPSISEERGRMSPLPGPQFRSQTPTRGPERTYTPSGPPPRAMTAGNAPGDRSFTPNGFPPRAMTPSGGPTLPRLQNPSPAGYIPYSAEPRTMTPASSNLPSATYRSFNEQTRSYSPFRPQPQGSAQYPQGRAPPQRHDSGVDDILDHY
ncbi:Potassium transporter [Exophiala xenobiotica]|nr:Potassium transporter [Exophiala xenobiotica]KAK5398700.1 Potassium transporter [Exophiala xenobiotica]KAK5421352.1 Potassium transporter [Exophiala xenobiotica]KAK5465997.1 Potassium transporter [Exophiala xenobiotica]KAK5484114.1 Potassium transporter [Exophiala xenobiotica]